MPPKRRPAKRARRTLYELFLDKLHELSSEEQPFISNPTLREALRWDNERYTRIKAQLVSDGSISVGRGYGGSVGLAVGSNNDALKVFVSYSHADEKLKDAVLKHLKTLERMKLIK